MDIIRYIYAILVAQIIVNQRITFGLKYQKNACFIVFTTQSNAMLKLLLIEH